MAGHQLATAGNVEAQESAAGQLVEKVNGLPVEGQVSVLRTVLDVVEDVLALGGRERAALEEHFSEGDEGFHLWLRQPQ